MGICNQAVFGGGAMEFSLHLKHCGRQRDAVTGILILGSDPVAWLEFAAAWNLPTSTLQFLPVHETRQSGRSMTSTSTLVGGLCIRSAGEFSVEALNQTDVAAYRTRAQRLLLPVDAEINPVISDSDLLTLLAEDRHYVWHPSIGLVGYEPDQVLTVQDLLTTPLVQEVDWDAAEIGECLNSTIRNLLPEPSIDIGGILGMGQDDIGSKASNLNDAPRSPDEKSGAAIRDAVQGAADAASAAFAKAIHRITSRLPTSNTGSNALGRLHAWAESIVNQMSSGGGVSSGGNEPPPPDQRITTQRENELKRLMNLLQNDPDQGLKYALPMGGEDRSRGLGAAGDRLFENDANFNLNQLNRGGRADVWDVPWEYQVKLIETYRDLAQREQRLGRYRRAAYIYATLLNDLPAAAAALEAGGLFHDAAAIYREHLSDPTKAAACLRRGGFWEEAAQIYIIHEHWLDAAEMYVEVGREDEAREMFQKEIKDCQHRSDYVAAGELADQRLNDPELATTLLFTGWMQAANGPNCFRKLMLLNGRRGNHRDALWVMQQLTADDEFSRGQMEAAAEVCSEVTSSYPDDAVRTAARQHTLRLAAGLLKPNDSDDPSSHAVALSAVRALAGSDRLLQSDAYRFEAQCKLAMEQPQAPVAAKRSSTVKSAKHITTFAMEPAGMLRRTRWVDIVGSGSTVFRCGVSPSGRMLLARQELVLQRSGQLVSTDDVLILPKRMDLAPDTFQLRLSPDQSCVYPVSIPNPALWCDAEENQRVLQESDWVKFLTASHGELWDVRPTATGGMMCLNVLPGETEWDVQLNHEAANGLPGQPIRLTSIWNKINMPEGPVFVGLHLAKYAYVVIGCTLLRTSSSLAEHSRARPSSAETIVIDEFPDTPTRMVEAPAYTVPRIVLSFSQGARAIWTEQAANCPLAIDLVNPLTVFTKNGILAAACRESGRIEFYRLNNGAADLVCETECEYQIQHLTRGWAANEIMVLYDNGFVTRLEVPVR